MLLDEEFSQTLSMATRYVERLEKQLRERERGLPNSLGCGYLRVIRDMLLEGIIHMDRGQMVAAYLGLVGEIRICEEIALARKSVNMMQDICLGGEPQ
jgi:hypothetical protein